MLITIIIIITSTAALQRHPWEHLQSVLDADA